MKLAFSTLGCPDWTLPDIISAASDLGFDGVEMRGVGSEIYMPQVAEFSEKNIAATRERFIKAGLEIVSFSSGADLSDRSGIQFAVNEAQDYINLAAEYGSGFVRVLADPNIHTSSKIDDGFVCENLQRVCDYAKGKKVDILIETNGMFSDSRRTYSLLKSANRKNLALIWDLHHTYRYSSEEPEKTVSCLAGYIKHVHLKDSQIADGKINYCLMGDGDTPVQSALKALTSAGYRGYLCLEWVKRWSANLPEPGIVFPQYLSYIKTLLQSV